jgi:Major Facilitator Superfamily
VVASLAAAAVLLAAFVVTETRSRHPLLPMRLLRSRDRSGAFLISLCVGTAILGMFFFLTVFIQEVWGYSALRTGLAYLPFVPAILVMTVAAQRGVSRIGARPLLIAGSAVSAGGMIWLSRISEHSTYAGGMLGPSLLLGAGLGLVFVPVSLVILRKVNTGDAGVASSLVNVGQQVGGSIGLAVVGTVAWSAVAGSLRSAAAKAGGHASGARAAALPTQIYYHALATGFSWSYLVSAGVLALSLIIALFMLRVRRQDLSGADPAPAPADGSSSPGPGVRPGEPAGPTLPAPRPSARMRRQPERGAWPRCGEGASRPRARARATVSARRCVPSLAYRWRRWVRTVLCETYNSLAISGPDKFVGR